MYLETVGSMTNAGKKKVIKIVGLHEVVGLKGEFKVGNGIRERGGKLVAVVPGLLQLDEEKNEISVLPIPAGGRA
jgi:exosome complex RNA-binding protein Csl4